MLRFAWAIALATLLVLALRLTLLDPRNQTSSCAQLELTFESEDFKEALPDDPLLIIGNQRVLYWSTHLTSQKVASVVRRSSPGLNPDRINQCFARLVGFYQPSLVIIPVDTAFAVNADESKLLDALQGIIDQRSEYSLDFELWFIAPITSPRYALTDEAKLEALRKSGAEWASAKANVFWLDLQNNFATDSERADSKLFWPDGDTLNDAGYQRLTDALITISNRRK